MNVLVTGAAGFIGSHLVDALLARGDSVTGIDNFSTGRPGNLEAASANPAFTFIEADVSCIGEALEAQLAVHELILHFASAASPPAYAILQFETLRVNSAGTDWCCRLAARWNAKLVFASTSEVYGEPLEHPQRETYFGNVNPLGPRSCYNEGKRYAEALITAWIAQREIDARIVRIFNTYGRRMRSDDGRVVPQFIAQVLSGKPMSIAGSGDQTRAFCYVSDLVRGVLLCADAPQARAACMNLGNPQEISICELGELIAQIAQVKPRFTHLPAPREDPSRRCPDISLAKKMLNWSPTISLTEGLTRTIGAAQKEVGIGL